MTQTTPLHQFKVAVAQRLQKPPFNWAGACGFELAKKYDALIDRSWQEYEQVDAVAGLVDRAHMANKPVFRPTTTKGLEAAGCIFHKV